MKRVIRTRGSRRDRASWDHTRSRGGGKGGARER